MSSKKVFDKLYANSYTKCFAVNKISGNLINKNGKKLQAMTQ